MVGEAKKHIDELLKLPVEERSEAAEALLRSLEDEGEDDAGEVTQAWVTEIEHRVEKDEPGIAAETVFSEGRARLTSRS